MNVFRKREGDGSGMEYKIVIDGVENFLRNLKQMDILHGTAFCWIWMDISPDDETLQSEKFLQK